MRILVTGGLGTVGAGLVADLRTRGHHVISCDIAHQPDEGRILGLHRPKHAALCPLRCGRVPGKLERVMDCLGPFDYVYHCAAEFGRWNGEDFYETLWHTNAVGTKNLIRLQERLKFRLIHFSSSEVYGDWPELMVETAMDDHEIKQLNDYAMTKWVNEMQVRNSTLRYGTESSGGSAIQYIWAGGILQPVSFRELPLSLLRAERAALDGISRPLTHVYVFAGYTSVPWRTSLTISGLEKLTISREVITTQLKNSPTWCSR